MDKSVENFFDIQTLEDVTSDKLPSNLEVLSNLFHNTRVLNKDLNQSAVHVVDNVLQIWKDVGIPTNSKQRCINKLLKFHERWRDVQKNANRKSKHTEENVTILKQDCHQIFDIANNVAVQTADKQIKEFLDNQRKGRIGSIQELKQSLQIAVTSSQDLESTFQSSQATSVETVSQHLEEYFLNSEDSVSDEGPLAKKSRGTIEICTPKVVAALDRSKVSTRNAPLLIISVLEAAGLNPNDYIVNATSIYEKRKTIREEMFKKIKEEFGLLDLPYVIVHWDGKLLLDLTGKSKVDRLPVILSCEGITKLLCVCKLDNSQGKTQAEAIFEVLQEWGISNIVRGLCCDTTNSNLGRINGAAVLLEQMLERDIAYFPCRHHILELLLRASFEALIPGTVGPNVPLFERFKSAWSTINSTAFQAGISDPVVNAALENDIENIEALIRRYLKLNLEREDYAELLHLSLLFIGVQPKENYIIKEPGPTHHARWMAKAIYCLKMFLFRKPFKCSKSVAAGLQQVSIFIVKVYIKYWFEAELAEKAPRNDLMLLKECYEFRSINVKISDVVKKKIMRHLWYLIPENAALAFFDDDVTVAEKREMVERLKEIKEAEDDEDDEDDEDNEEETKRIIVKKSKVPTFCQKSISYFITKKSLIFFERFNLNTDWINLDPTIWQFNEDYLRNKKTVHSFKVVNDVAERSIKLFQDFNRQLTKDEDQQQYIMHCLEKYRERFSTSNKTDLIGDL